MMCDVDATLGEDSPLYLLWLDQCAINSEGRGGWRRTRPSNQAPAVTGDAAVKKHTWFSKCVQHASGEERRAALRSLTAADVSRVLNYDPITGIFRWKYRDDVGPSMRAKLTGKIAGSNQRNAVCICVFGLMIKAHRLAWLVSTGYWPDDDVEVDHIDGDWMNNSISNLRLAMHHQNGANTKIRSTNTTGYKGVTYIARTKRWRAQISVRGKYIHLGYHDTAELAHAAYASAAVKHFGEFARMS